MFVLVVFAKSFFKAPDMHAFPEKLDKREKINHTLFPNAINWFVIREDEPSQVKNKMLIGGVLHLSIFLSLLSIKVKQKHFTLEKQQKYLLNI